jgi:hypothetical protein
MRQTAPPKAPARTQPKKQAARARQSANKVFIMAQIGHTLGKPTKASPERSMLARVLTAASAAPTLH